MTRAKLLRSVPLAVAFAAAPLLVGCQTGPTTDKYELELTGREKQTLSPEARSYAEENYRGVMMGDLKHMKAVEFLDPAVISAHRNIANGHNELTVAGTLEADELSGQRLRRPFFVSWEQAGSGWRVLVTHVGEGTPAPEKKKPLGNMLSGPKTKPATQP